MGISLTIELSAENMEEFQKLLAGPIGALVQQTQQQAATVTPLHVVPTAPTQQAAASAPQVTADAPQVTADAPQVTSEAPKTRSRRSAAAAIAPKPEPATTGMAVSTGEPRVDPAVAAQDRADESADKTASPSLTHDDVRKALGIYVQHYGLPAAQEDGPEVLRRLFGDGVKTVSAIPHTQEALQRTVAGVNEMIAKNPFKRAPVVTG